MRVMELFVAPEAAGERLDRFLAATAPGLSRARIQALIAAGHVTRNGSASKASTRLRAGDAIALREPPARATETRPEAIALAILYEDADLIVVDKPAGMVVHPAAGNWEGTLVNALLHHCRDLSGIGGEQRPGIVHRLDKETSGCLVAAKNDFAHERLAAQFAGRAVTKIYLAIEAPIARHPAQRKKMAVAPNRGRAARTEWRVLRELGAATLVECTLYTGRTHQIRVHLQHLGHPLLGDAVYGRRASFLRQMLHAWKLGFTHPRTGAPMHFVSPIPRDFVEAGVPPDLA
jgi:23S rRNA pseudouridine1911/1915/1917 synthase